MCQPPGPRHKKPPLRPICTMRAPPEKPQAALERLACDRMLPQQNPVSTPSPVSLRLDLGTNWTITQLRQLSGLLCCIVAATQADSEPVALPNVVPIQRLLRPTPTSARARRCRSVRYAHCMLGEIPLIPLGFSTAPPSSAPFCHLGALPHYRWWLLLNVELGALLDQGRWGR